MAARLQQTERREEDLTNEILSQIFGQVKVTFSADDSCVGPIPLNDREFVKGLQAESGVTLKCELKFENGDKQPAKYFLEGTWDQVNQAKEFLEHWVKRGDGRDTQGKSENRKIPEGVQRNGLNSQASSQERIRHTNKCGTGTRLKENELLQGRMNSHELQGNGRSGVDVEGQGGDGDSERNGSTRTAVMVANVTEDHASHKRDKSSSFGNKHRTSGNGEAYNREKHEHSSHDRDSPTYSASSALVGDHQPPPGAKPRQSREERGGGGSSHSSSVKSRKHISFSGLKSPIGASDAVRNENGRKDSSVLPRQFLSPTADGPATAANLRETSDSERVADNHGTPQNDYEGQEHHRHPNEHISSASDARERPPHPPRASPHYTVPLEDPNSSPEIHQALGGKESISFVPVDAGVYAYIQKMHNTHMKSIERQFNVTISAEDMDVNESAMLKITPIGTTTDESIRAANEAVVDLYSSVFGQLTNRFIQLEDSSIASESLKRGIADVEKLYKEVLVKVSGSKVMIYGMKELDVKVAKAMVTNRLYDTVRSASAIAHHNKDNDERLSDDHLKERHPLPGHEDADHRSAHQDLQHLEAAEEYPEDAANGEDQDLSPRLQDDEEHLVTPKSLQKQAPLKYRLKHNRLSYRTAEGLKVRVYHGDITKEKVGAIVNAANESLKHAGGVAAAIAKAAGPLLTEDCKHYISTHGLLYPGKVTWTTAGNLPSQFVIHAVGPRWDEYKNKTECYETLKTTFLNCFDVAEKKLLVAAIAMPLVSSGIFGMPITQSIDALYEAIVQFSKSWNPATHLLQEINVVEIHDASVKAIQGHLIGKLTGDGGGAVVRHLDLGNQEASDLLGSRSDQREYPSAGRNLEKYRNDNLTGLDHRSSPYSEDNLGRALPDMPDERRQEKIDDLFASSEPRQTHEGTQTSLLYPNAQDLLKDRKLTGASHFRMGDDLGRITTEGTGMHKFSSLPNLPRRNTYDDDYSSSYRHLTDTSAGSRTSPLSTHLDIQLDATSGGRYPSRSSHILDSLGSDISQRKYDPALSTRKHDTSYERGKGGAEILRASGGLKEKDNESLINSILKQHDRSKQTAEEIAETQKLLNHLLKEDGMSSHQSHEKGHRSRRTQSLDRGTRRTKDRDHHLENYDLHSDRRVKGKGLDHSDNQTCSSYACFSTRDLTQRKDCEHMLCRTCFKAGMYKGSCIFCKSKGRDRPASAPTASSSDSQRSRPRTKKTMPDAKALPLPGHSNFHVRPSSSSVKGQRGGPLVALSATTPPSSPELHAIDDSRHHTTSNFRLDPDGQAPDKGLGSRDAYSRSNSLPGSKKDNRVEAWVANSNPTFGPTARTYDQTSYMGMTEVVHGSTRSSARQRRHKERELAARLSFEEQKQDLSSKDKSGTGRDKGTGEHAATTSVASKVMCPICMDVIKNPKTLSECKHTFCTSCIDKAMKLKALCPVCGVVYGQLYGNQPAGTMTNYVEPTDLPGHEGCGTIVISYRFPDGVQSEDHPNPGQPFRGTARMAYLPNNIEGQEVFRLLEKAFKARLLFTVGQSVTTGQQNTLVWNDIHHKTRRTGGAENHGYPDPSYLKRVKEELSAKGIK